MSSGYYVIETTTPRNSLNLNLEAADLDFVDLDPVEFSPFSEGLVNHSLNGMGDKRSRMRSAFAALRNARASYTSLEFMLGFRPTRVLYFASRRNSAAESVSGEISGVV